jgi:TonB-linked SusC/RagA family outer membrane protein
MKIKPISILLYLHSANERRLKIMKLILFGLLLSVLHASGSIYSQNTFFNLNHNNITVIEALKLLESDSDYKFLYRSDMIDINRTVDLKGTDKNVQDVLSMIFPDGNASFMFFEDNLVAITTEPFLEQQQIVVTGVVRDATGNPLPGATIVIRGTTTGTVTNVDGEYSLPVPDRDAILVISFVGYLSREILVGENNTINITLEEEVRLLDEIVVVGYGTQRRANLTGAVDHISSDAFENRPITNLNQGLQGLMPNVNIRLMDGNPAGTPAINIRGTTSIGAGGEALILIDGVEGDPSLVNPNDIETISVLKDAASAAIYGARGAFGVILITTKSAPRDRMNITYSTNYSRKSPTTVFDHVTDPYLFATMFNEAHLGVTDYATPPLGINKTIRFSPEYLEELRRRSDDPSLPKTDINPATGDYWYFHNTNWYEELQKSSLGAQEHNLSLSGGTDVTSFYLSGRFFEQEGVFRYNSDDYSTGNIRAQGSAQLLPWMRINNNFEYSNRNYHYPIDAAGEQVGPWAMIALEHFPMAPLHNPDGSLTYSAAYGVGDFWYGKNAMIQNVNRFRNTTGVTADFFDNSLRVNSDFTYTHTNRDDRTIRVPVPYSVRPGVTEWLGAHKNDLEDNSRKTNYYSFNLYGEYENYFADDHYLKLLAGTNYEESEFNSLFSRRDGLIFPDARDLNLAIGDNMSIRGGYEKWRTLGTFFRINYIFDNRYLFEVNARYDGSSKFPSYERFAFFPSVSLGWRITQEPWWNFSERIFSDIKFRGSYGSLGNGNISSYRFQELYSIRSQHSRSLGGIRPAWTNLPTILPDGLTWETSTTRNLGIDVAMLSNRLQFVGDAYVRKTTDMFTVGPTLPAVFGATPPRGNYADLETRGWEMMLAWRDRFTVNNRPLNFQARLSLSDNVSKVLRYNNPDKRLNDYYEGQTIGEIWGYVTEGFFTSMEDIANHADQSFIRQSNGRVLLPGDIKFQDLNDDGVINAGDNTYYNPGDRQIIGNSMPRYMYGAQMNMDWNNVFFNIFFQGVAKQDWYPSAGASLFWGQYNRTYNDIPTWHLEPGIIWSEENPDSYFPRYRGHNRIGSDVPGRALAPQTKYMQNVAYVRLKNIQLGYNLPEDLVSRISANAARIYVTGENLWAWSPLYRRTKDIDVENIRRSDSFVRPAATYNAGDAYNYPVLRSVTMGLSVTF